MKKIIVKNTTQAEKTLSEVRGILLPVGTYVDLTEYAPFTKISDSSQLRAWITDSEVIINDSSTDLSVIEALDYLDFKPTNNDIHLSFRGGSDNYLRLLPEIPGVWQEVATLIFRGSSVLGIPKTAKVVSRADGLNTNGNIRIYDTTNQNVIAMWAVVETYWSIISGEVSNIPPEEALFSVQGKYEANTVLISSLMIGF